MGVLKTGNRDKNNETGLKKGGVIEINISTSAFVLTQKESKNWLICAVPLFPFAVVDVLVAKRRKREWAGSTSPVPGKTNWRRSIKCVNADKTSKGAL